jgi:hypothetical protein
MGAQIRATPLLDHNYDKSTNTFGAPFSPIRERCRTPPISGVHSTLPDGAMDRCAVR